MKHNEEPIEERVAEGDEPRDLRGVARPPQLVFLGAVVEGAGPLVSDGRVLKAGDIVPLVRARSPWRRREKTERVIIGSNCERADVRLESPGIHGEHLRIYLDVAGGPTDMRAMQPGSTRLDGNFAEELEYCLLRGGETIEIARWSFRYEPWGEPGSLES